MRASIKSIAATAFAAALVLALAGSALAAARFHLQLSGAVEPLGGDADATGTATITINTGQRTLCYDVSWEDIGGDSEASDLVWGGHIHNAPAGVNGGISVHLFGAPHEAPTAFPGTFSVSDCVTVDRSLLKAIRAHPDQYYLNLHNDEHPAGVIRAQLG